MTTGTAKKAMVYRFEREPLSGFIDSANPILGEEIQLLNREGAIQMLPLRQIKTLCFVRDWLDGLPWTRSQYSVRPRQQGLWVRLQFKDGELLEATMQNSLTLLDPAAILISPPDAAPGVQRVLVPRSALEGFEVLGVIGSPLKKTPRAPTAQLKMFE